MNRFTRRRLLALLGTGGILLACSAEPSTEAERIQGNIKAVASPTPVKPRADIYLEGDEKQLAASVKGLLGRTEKLVINPGEELTIAFPTDSGWESLRLSFEKGGANTWTLVKERTGDRANLTITENSLFPTVLLVNQEKTQSSQRSLEKIPTNLPELLEIGSLLVGAVLAIWLAVIIGKAILATLSLLIFTALLVGIFAFAASLIAPKFQSLIRSLRIDVRDIEEFFTQKNERLQEILNRISLQLAN